MRRSVPNRPVPGTSSISAPSARSASVIRSESSECSGDVRVDGESASAASTSLRLVSDFDPGTSTVASRGLSPTGAAHGDEPAPEVADGEWEYPGAVIGFYPNERL